MIGLQPEVQLKLVLSEFVKQARQALFSFSVACAALIAAISPSSLYGDVLGYYPFDSDTADHDNFGNANDLSFAGTPEPVLTTGNGGMFGEALSFSGGNGVAQRTDPDSAAADFDIAFSNFSVGFWMKPDSWIDSSTAIRLVTGKTTGSSTNRGWVIQKLPGAINQLQFAFFPATSGSAIVTLTTAFDTEPSSSEFMYVAATYQNGGTENPHVASFYVNGQAVQTLETTAVAVNGANTGDFEIGNRGVQTNSASATSYLGLIDDYGIAGDFASPQQVALTHGLGRFVGVNLGSLNAGMTSTQILDVLNAYNSQTSAIAGAQTWNYWSNLNQGTTVGVIGGTIGGGDAFIVLGSDGSGVSIATPPVTVPGDFNGDGKVDAADYVLWRKNPSSFLPATYDTWRANFGIPPGSGTGLGGASVVPEPAVLGFFGAAIVGLFFFRRRQ
jgi:hypothetical protein